MAEQIRLSDLIAPPFYDVYWDIQEERHTYYDLYGGRGSTKSSFAALMIVLGMMQDPCANAIAFRKVGNTISTSVFSQLQWAVDMLGVAELWKSTTSPHRMIYTPTGQTILFRGLDSSRKLKSIKVSRGYLKYLWLEELDEYAGEAEIRSVQQSVLRGGDKYVVFKTFNPPISRTNWANQYVQTPRESALRHKSCYLDVPREWLGEQFFEDANDLKLINPRAYEHEYLGVPTGTGGEVFENLEIREISTEEVRHFDRLYNGVDWGYYPDPWAFNQVHYDAARRTVYIFGELHANKLGNQETAAMLRSYGIQNADIITADSAEPKSVADYRTYGLNCYGAIKGPGSLGYSMKWLQSLSRIVIDPVRCPQTAKEFSNYEYERTKDGEIMTGYPDKDNHHIDATRYALESVWKWRGQ